MFLNESDGVILTMWPTPSSYVIDACYHFAGATLVVTSYKTKYLAISFNLRGPAQRARSATCEQAPRSRGYGALHRSPNSAMIAGLLASRRSR